MYKNKIFRNVSVFVKGSVELVWTPEAETEAGRTIKSLLSTRELKNIYIQRDRRRQERVGIGGGGTGECCGPEKIWRAAAQK